jgi:hypothetical protein
MVRPADIGVGFVLVRFVVFSVADAGREVDMLKPIELLLHNIGRPYEYVLVVEVGHVSSGTSSSRFPFPLVRERECFKMSCSLSSLTGKERLSTKCTVYIVRVH